MSDIFTHLVYINDLVFLNDKIYNVITKFELLTNNRSYSNHTIPITQKNGIKGEKRPNYKIAI